MKSKKSIWVWKAKSVKITKTCSLTVEDSRKIYPSTEKRILQAGARRLVKKMLKKKRRSLPQEMFED